MDALRSVLPKQASYHLVGNDAVQHSTRWNHSRQLIASRSKTIALFALSLVALFVFVLLPSSEIPVATTKHDDGVKPSSFHFVVPASNSNANLCKVMVSGAIAGYPSPAIINWNKTFDVPGQVSGGSHLAKIEGLYEYANNLDHRHDEDLMLVVDGYDIWMQLRPQTLIDRYFEINRRADERLKAELGDLTSSQNIRQEIVFGGQKRCWPWKKSDPPCYAVPQSTLPKDIFGPETDTDIHGNSEIDGVGSKINLWEKYRPRSLNSGVAIGTVRAWRKLLREAQKQMKADPNFGSDQFIFSHIFGDQEIWREFVRRDALATRKGIKGDTGREARNEQTASWNENHLSEVRKKAYAREEKNFEFGIGIDYDSLIGLNTVFAEDDTRWLRFENTTALQTAQDDVGVDSARHRADYLATDIAQSLPPFWTFSNEDRLQRWTPWSALSLFTDVWTGITPAVIHHTAHRDNMKARREYMWPYMWFANHTRTLYDATLYQPLVPIAVSGYGKAQTREWWPWEMARGGGRDGINQPSLSRDGFGGDSWVHFKDICKDYHEEVFRDGRGEWNLPANH